MDALIRRRRFGPHRLRDGRREHLPDASPKRSPSWRPRRTSPAAACRSSRASRNSPPPSPPRRRGKPQRVGIDGVMVMPALVYSSKPHETAAHFRGVAKATDLPVMVYNNPPIYKNDVTPDILASLADCETIVCFKESSRRHAPLHRSAQHGRRPLRDVRRPRRRGGRERHGRRGPAGCRECRTPSRAKARRCSASRAPAATRRRCRSTNGSCRCSTSTPARTSCSASSFASTSWAAERI